MKRRASFFVVCSFFICVPAYAEESLRLPYAAGESMLVSRGYDTPSTHVNKDRYALDFVQGGCKSFGKEVRAVRSGVVSFMNIKDTWGGGYGKNIILDHGDGRVSRYAHFNAYATHIEKGVFVPRGQIIGYQGNTGNVLGTACKEHPGTHLHFSVLQQNEPVKPEPMSLYEQFSAGNWYLSDNIYPDPGIGSALYQDINESLTKNDESWISLLWQKLFSFFRADDTQNETEKQPVIEQEPILPSNNMAQVKDEKKEEKIQGMFESEDIEIEVPQESSDVIAVIRVKNSGSVSWSASSVSLQIVGEEKDATSFYHPSWITALRPAAIETDIVPNAWVSIPFMAHMPENLSNGTVQIQLVHFDGKKFSRIDMGFVSIRIVRFVPKASPVVFSPPDAYHETEIPVINTSSAATSLYIPEAHHHGLSVSPSGSGIAVASALVASPSLVIASLQQEASGEENIPPSSVVVSTTTPSFSFPTSTLETITDTTPTISIDITITPTSTTSVPSLEEVDNDNIGEQNSATSTASTTIITSTSTDFFVTSTQEHIPIPRQENREIPLYCTSNSAIVSGSIFVSEEQYIRTQTFDGRDIVMLTEEQGPYIFDIDTHIPKGKILRIEEGVTFMGINKQASLRVEGELQAEGSEEQPIHMTSICGEAGQPGDWSHIHIAPGGLVQLKHVTIAYGGNPFTVSSGALASSYKVSRIMFNEGGSLLLDHVRVEKSYVKTMDERFNAYIWTEHVDGFIPRSISEYSSYSGGYEAIHIEGKNNNQYIEGRFIQNSFSYFTSPRGPVSFYRDMPFIDTLILTENTKNTVYLNDVHIIDSVQLQKDMTYLLSGITIEKNAMLFVPAGAQLRLLPGTDIFVNGELIMKGTEDSPIIIQPDSTKWGSIIFSDAKGSVIGVDMSGGGLSASTPSGRSRMVYAVDSDILIEDSHLHDSRIPGALFEAEQSVVSVSNNIFSWASPVPVSSWITYGVFMDGGEISMENNIFQNVVMPLYATEKTIIKEMDQEEVFKEV